MRIVGGACFVAAGVYLIHQFGTFLGEDLIPSGWGAGCVVTLVGLWVYASWRTKEADPSFPQPVQSWLNRAEYFFYANWCAVMMGIVWNFYHGIALTDLNLFTKFGARGGVACFWVRVGAQLWYSTAPRLPSPAP